MDDARFNLGVCQMQQEDYQGAVDTFTELIGDGKQPEDGNEQTEDDEKETEVENEETEVGSENVNDGAYYYRAVCNTALGNLEEAKADYTVCIEHEYELAQSYYQRAQVYAALGDTEAQNADLQASLSVAG